MRGRRRRLARRWVLAAALGLVALGAVAVTALVSSRLYRPSGAVLATVAGREITADDLQAEARAQSPDSEVDRATLLKAVVDRVLLAQEAKAQGLDATSVYPSDKVRSDELVLATQLLRTLPPPPQPDAKAVQGYVQGHPEMFQERKFLHLRQLQFTADDAVVRDVASAASLPELQEALRLRGVHAQASESVINSAEFGSDLVAALVRLPPQRILITRQGDQAVASELLQAEPAALRDRDAAAQAQQSLIELRRKAQLETLLVKLRARGRVLLQPPSSRPL